MERPLTTFYKGWESYQRRLIAMIAPLTAEQLALPAGTHHWTISMVTQHMIADRVWWFHLWMGQGSSELARILRWDPGAVAEPPVLTAAELVAGLEVSWSIIAAALDRWTGADLGDVLSPPPSLSEAERNAFGKPTRQWIVWHVLEHEIHHGGELSLALGGYDMPGIYGRA